MRIRTRLRTLISAAPQLLRRVPVVVNNLARKLIAPTSSLSAPAFAAAACISGRHRSSCTNRSNHRGNTWECSEQHLAAA